MNPISLVFFLACALALFTLPRKWAPAALLVGCTYMTLGQGIEIASINLPIYRMMLLVGLIRVMFKNERIVGGLNTIDKLVIAWSLWSIFAGFFHDQERYSVIYFCGGVFNVASIYFLIRILCNDIQEVQGVIAIVAVILVPIAIEMMLEKASGKNLFSFLGGVPENVYVREGKLRAQGHSCWYCRSHFYPFVHRTAFPLPSDRHAWHRCWRDNDLRFRFQWPGDEPIGRFWSPDTLALPGACIQNTYRLCSCIPSAYDHNDSTSLLPNFENRYFGR
jgi:hypothetical protein